MPLSDDGSRTSFRNVPFLNQNEVKVKVVLCLIKYHVMKCGGAEICLHRS
jgi:hypothetical protein